jgi:putative oxidoreductase
MLMPALNKHSDWALLILRLVIGAIFIYHGMLKWSMEDPNTMFTILKFAEPLGGLALILGVLPQLAALGLSIIMLGAIYMKATGFGQGTLDFAGTFAPQGGTGWEFDLMILAGCLVILFMGAGRLALGRMMHEKLA